MVSVITQNISGWVSFVAQYILLSVELRKFHKYLLNIITTFRGPIHASVAIQHFSWNLYLA